LDSRSASWGSEVGRYQSLGPAIFRCVSKM
jgi:hypothetical protein